MNKEDLKKAIRCCREDDCENCPALGEICDNLRVDMEDLPVELVDLVIEILDRETELCDRCGRVRLESSRVMKHK